MKGSEKQVKYANDLIEIRIVPLMEEIKENEEFQSFGSEDQEMILKSIVAMVDGFRAADARDVIDLLKKDFLCPDDFTALDKWEFVAGTIEAGEEDHSGNTAIKIIRSNPDFRAIYEEV